jgi:hypothetical protein
MPRYNLQTQDLESLGNYLADLKRITSSLEGHISSLRADMFQAIEVPNNTIGMRGLEYCSKFVESVRQSHITARAARGDYRGAGRRAKGK